MPPLWPEHRQHPHLLARTPELDARILADSVCGGMAADGQGLAVRTEDRTIDHVPQFERDFPARAFGEIPDLHRPGDTTLAEQGRTATRGGDRQRPTDAGLDQASTLLLR